MQPGRSKYRITQNHVEEKEEIRAGAFTMITLSGRNPQISSFRLQVSKQNTSTLSSLVRDFHTNALKIKPSGRIKKPKG